MRKFKHKLTKDILFLKDDEEGAHISFLGDQLIPKRFITDSNDWEEIVETKKYYEILSIRDKESNLIVRKEHIENTNYSLEIDYLKRNSNTWKINSVKRLSDGEIFTIGDKIKHKSINTTTNINYINLRDNHIFFDVYSNIIGDTLLENAIKYKKPLFITKDNVEIFENDEYFRVFKKDWKLYNLQTFTTSGYNFNIMNKQAWHFSTEQAAKEYIIMNKPCLSYKDVVNFISNNSSNTLTSRGQKTLKELIKLKLNL